MVNLDPDEKNDYMYVAGIHVHPQWEANGTLKNAGDVAMIYLKPTDYKNHEFIPILGEQKAEVLPYFSNCSLLGWPYKKLSVEYEKAHRVDVNVVSQDICYHIYKEWAHYDGKLCVQTVNPEVHFFFLRFKSVSEPTVCLGW